MSEKFVLVVGLDFGSCGVHALRSALAVAKASTTIHIIHVVTDSDLDRGNELIQQERALARLPETMWEKVFSTLDDLGLRYDEAPPMELHVRLGKPAETIKQVAVDYDADLVIVGTHGRQGVRRLVLGSVAETLVRDGHFPVLVAHENALAQLEKTVLPDAPHPEGHVVQPTRERPHIYRSTLISAWSALHVHLVGVIAIGLVFSGVGFSRAPASKAPSDERKHSQQGEAADDGDGLRAHVVPL